MRLLYSVLVSLVVWTVLVPFTVVQIARRRATWSHVRERLGLGLALRASPRHRVLVHAVSAGEAAAACRFIEALAGARPSWSVVFTCGTRDARSLALRLQQRLLCIESVVLLPWDRAHATVRALRDLQATAVVVVEPEIWPNLYRACDVLRVPLFLINARVYPRDVARYRLARRFFADVMRVPAVIAAQSDADRDALVSIGAPPGNVFVAGSLKFDAAADASQSEIVSRIRATFDKTTRIILAGSSHRPDEEVLLRSLEALRSRFRTVRLIIAPRHIDRVEEVEALAASRGHRTIRASQARGRVSWDVLIVDSVGDLPSLYALADVAVVGGTFAARGGHNVMEPARHGRAIVVGPHVENVRHLVDGLAAARGIVRLESASLSALTDASSRLLADDTLRRELGDRARDHAARHAGAAARCVEFVVGALTEAGLTHASPERWRLGAIDAKS